MSFDLAAVRAQFPALALTDSGTRRIYFDNPGGTQVVGTPFKAVLDETASSECERQIERQSRPEVQHRDGRQHHDDERHRSS